MTDAALELVPIYGFWIVLSATFLSCLAMPIPSSFIMLAGGAFIASGDLAFWDVVCGAFVGAILGDQVGYWLGKTGGSLIKRKSERSKTTADFLNKAQVLIKKRGGIAVFLSRWLLSPLGPYVNLMAGGGHMRWLRFSLWGAAGEVVWVTIYVGLGYFFAGQIIQVAEIAGNAIGLITGLALTFVLGRAVFKHESVRKS